MNNVTTDWLLPITSFETLGSNEETKIEIGDIVCQDVLSIHIIGDLKNTLPEKSYKKYVSGVKSINIEFDFEVLEWVNETNRWDNCVDLVYIDSTSKTFGCYRSLHLWPNHFPRIEYCPKDKKLEIWHTAT